jgi:type II secretory pathway component PulJ
MTMIYGIGIMMALLGGGAIGLFLAVAHYHRVAEQHRKYEQEISRDRELYAAAQAVLQRYKSTSSKNG